jgi:hypothetical protein
MVASIGTIRGALLGVAGGIAVRDNRLNRS